MNRINGVWYIKDKGFILYNKNLRELLIDYYFFKKCNKK